MFAPIAGAAISLGKSQAVAAGRGPHLLRPQAPPVAPRSRRVCPPLPYRPPLQCAVAAAARTITPANAFFRELVNEVKFHHVHCPKREMTLLAHHIVETVRCHTPPDRFLAKASATGLWHDVGDGNARKKTSQVLRDVSDRRAGAAAPSRRR